MRDSRQEKEVLEGYAFDEYLDRCIMEVILNQMLDDYSNGEERDLHTKELIDKKKRVRISTMKFCIG
jgi:predicted nucleotidyltransferase